MVPAGKIHDKEEANWNFFLSLPDVDRTKVRTDNIRSMQVRARCSNSPAPVPAAVKPRM